MTPSTNASPRLYTISNLNNGVRVRIPGLRDTMRGLEIVNVTDAATLITGQKRNGIHDAWGNFTDRVANSILVEIREDEDENGGDRSPLNNPQITQNKRNNGGIGLNKDNNEDIGLNMRPGKRRRNKEPVRFPDGEFTIKDIAGVNHITPAVAYLRVQKAISEGKVVWARSQGGKKGKPQNFYKAKG